MVLEIIQRLFTGNYGFPKQGKFFPTNKKPEEHSLYYEGIYNNASTRLKSKALKKRTGREND